jgi:hypothetical protein
VGFRLDVADIDLESTLVANGELLMQKPMGWPEPTNELAKAQIAVHFDFVPLSSKNLDTEEDSEPVRSYRREIEVYDPMGGVFLGSHKDSDTILRQLGTCDIAMLFVPAKVFLDVASEDEDEQFESDLVALRARLAWGKIIETLGAIKGKLKDKETFPVCVVITQSDLLWSRRDATRIINDLIYQHLLIPLSEKYPHFMICGCLVSVVDTKSGNFKATNLEWPFLYAVGGTIMRNALDLKSEADKASELAEKAQAKAEQLASLRWASPWRRFLRLVTERETVGMHRRAAASYVTESGRKVRLANEDFELARDIWSSIAAEGREYRSLRVLMGGGDVEDPRFGIGMGV